jgi:hypothetical protein
MEVFMSWLNNESQQEEYFRNQNNKEKWGDAGGPIDAILLHPIRTIKKVGPIILVLLVIGAVSNMCNGSEKTKMSQQNQTRTQVAQQAYVFVNTDALNMRNNPSPQASVVTLLHRNDRVQIIGNVNSSTWIKVRFGEYEGYVNGSYLKQ